MKRSSHVTAPLLAAAAFAITAGCEKPQMQRCVDENNHVVDDSLCANQPAQTGQQYQNFNGGGYVPYYPRYHYYYGGWGGYGIGTPVSGGSYFPDPAHSYASRSGAITTRGGFGRSFGGDEGGEGHGSGEGGGHGGGSGE